MHIPWDVFQELIFSFFQCVRGGRTCRRISGDQNLGATGTWGPSHVRARQQHDREQPLLSVQGIRRRDTAAGQGVAIYHAEQHGGDVQLMHDCTPLVYNHVRPYVPYVYPSKQEKSQVFLVNATALKIRRCFPCGRKIQSSIERAMTGRATVIGRIFPSVVLLRSTEQRNTLHCLGLSK